MHMVNPELLRRAVRVVLIGCGGSGSAIASGLPFLHQAMVVAGHPGGLHVTVMDGDIISPTNCIRQPLCSAEIGLAKGRGHGQPLESVLGPELDGCSRTLNLPNRPIELRHRTTAVGWTK